MYARVCMCLSVCACVRACVRACVCVCVAFCCCRFLSKFLINSQMSSCDQNVFALCLSAASKHANYEVV